MSFCPKCGTETVRGKKVLFGKHKGWCTKCSMDAAYEEHYKKRPEKRPTGDKMTHKQELIATMAHQPLTGDKALR
jgi:hypothetical protein